MNQREAKAHPMYNTLYAQLGEKAAIAAIIAQDGEKQKENQSDVSVSEGARKIVIPATMSKMDAAVELKRQYEDEENVINLRAMVMTKRMSLPLLVSLMVGIGKKYL